MPGCGVAGFLPVFLGFGLPVILSTPGTDVRDPTLRAPSGSDASLARDHRLTDRTISRIGAFRTPPSAARRAVEAAAPPASRNRLHGIAGQLIDEEHLDHCETHHPHERNG